MANISVSVKMQQRVDTSSTWQSSNPTLLVGEIGIESDTGKIKVGNGLTAWNSLAYIGITTEYLDANYLPKSSPTVNGAITLEDSSSQIQKTTTSPNGHNIGVTGVMTTYSTSGDEGGLLVSEDGAYLWNSTDSGSALMVLDEDAFTSVTNKKDAVFTNGLLFQIDSSGNVKCKGNFYDTNGATKVSATTTLSASNITITSNSNLGSTTNLQTALTYIANVFAGTQSVTKLKAGTFDAV